MKMIPAERLDAFASFASAFGDIEDTITTIRQICGHRRILQDEGRSNALDGANHLLAGCVRRLCATAAATKEQADAKCDMLVELRQIYHGGFGEAHLLIGAMIDAAVGFETESWPISSGVH